MERIVITMDDDGSIDITAKSEGGDVETMEAMDVDQALDIVREVMMESQSEDAMDDEMEDDPRSEDQATTDEEVEQMFNEEAEKRAKDREIQASYE